MEFLKKLIEIVYYSYYGSFLQWLYFDLLKRRSIGKVTPGNLLWKLPLIGPWSSYALASAALQHYFPEKYDENGESDIGVNGEAKLLDELGLKYWQDVIVKYHREVGYKPNELSNTDFVNQY